MPTPETIISHSLLLPELKVQTAYLKGRFLQVFEAEKKNKGAVCTRCACLSTSGYDRREVTVKDAPVRGRTVILKIKKRRYWCKTCKKPFTEPVEGIMPKRRTTQRFRRSLLWACENFSDLKSVRKAYRCSNDLIYKALYEQLELKRRTRLYPWPKVIGIDEHAFKRNKRFGCTDFVSMIVDHSNKRVMEVVDGKTTAALHDHLKKIPGRENVKVVTIDMCDPFKNFINESFPNAEIVADKFHVLRLLTPALLRHRKNIAGNRANMKAKKLLLMSSKNLDYFSRRTIWDFLENYPDMKELYSWKEAIHGFYRIRGYDRACIALQKMLDRMALSNLKEIKTLRKTLQKWKNQILNYFKFRITNARTEGFNNVAKVIKRRSYGFRNFNHYRLRLLNACS